MIKKFAIVLCVAALCAGAFSMGYIRGEYAEAHKTFGGYDIQYWDANGNLQPTGYKTMVYDRSRHIIVAAVPIK